MKTKIYFIAILFAAMATVTSCKKEDNSNSTSASANISNIITSGSWRVSYYHESGIDHTINYSGYVFTFNSNGSMTAADSSGTTTGTWRADDSNMNEFHITIGTISPLIDINNGWLIIARSAAEVDLKDDDTAHSEELHFMKI